MRAVVVMVVYSVAVEGHTHGHRMWTHRPSQFEGLIDSTLVIMKGPRIVQEINRLVGTLIRVHTH
jgi:hypothetical protein